MTTPLIRKVITAGFGATGGGEFRVDCYDIEDRKVEELVKAPIKWDTRNSKLRMWDIEWLKQIAEFLRSRLKSGIALKLYGWGADIAVMAGSKVLAAPTYASVMEMPGIPEFIEGFDPLEWHQQFGGACQKPWQPMAQLRAIQNACPGVLEKADCILPVMDLLFYLVTGQMVADRVMAQTQGLLAQNENSYFDSVFGIPRLAELFVSRFYAPGVWADKGVYVSTATHDSPAALDVAFSTGSTWALWTGTFCGVAGLRERLQLDPCEATCKAGFAFEGVAVEESTCRLPFWKELMKIAGLEGCYDLAAEESLQRIDRGIPDSIVYPDLSALTKMGNDDALRSVLSACGQNPILAMAVTVDALANLLVKRLRELAEIAGCNFSSDEQVAVVGGWAKNKAFVTLLQRKGLSVHIPPHAAEATAYGVAAAALAQACDLKLTTALELLP